MVTMEKLWIISTQKNRGEWIDEDFVFNSKRIALWKDTGPENLV